MMAEPHVKAPAFPQVFVSYSRSDVDQVLSIAQQLERAGVSIWRDNDGILGGHYYGAEIVHALAHSKVVLIMCSEAAFRSDNVHREILLTWEYYHRTYVPVWLSPRVEIPERFRYCLVGCQPIEVHGKLPEHWLPRLLAALEALGAGPSVPTVSNQAAGTDRAGRRKGGPNFAPGDRPLPGADWELVRLLGKGGYGEVWLARNPDLPGQEPVALKFCFDLDAKAKELLRHEADMVLRAQRSAGAAGMVPLLHTYLKNDPPCLEYPYIEGGTLVALIDDARQSGTGLTPLAVQGLVEQIARIVGAVHRATPQLVHRDLKPSNVLVSRGADNQPVIRVTDFGIGGIVARPLLDRSRSGYSLQENLSAILTGAYTPLYASPQQIQGSKPDPTDDVYSLGVIWYQLLIGDLTAPAPTGRMWVRSLKERGMTDAAIELLMDTMETSPEHRPADGAALAERLRELIEAETASTSMPRATPTVTTITPEPPAPAPSIPESGPAVSALAPAEQRPLPDIPPIATSPMSASSAGSGDARGETPSVIAKFLRSPATTVSPAPTAKAAGSRPALQTIEAGSAASSEMLYVLLAIQTLITWIFPLACLLNLNGPHRYIPDTPEGMAPGLMAIAVGLVIAGTASSVVSFRRGSSWGLTLGSSAVLMCLSGGFMVLTSRTAHDDPHRFVSVGIMAFLYPIALLPLLGWFMWREWRPKTAELQPAAQVPQLSVLAAVQLAAVLCCVALRWRFGTGGYSEYHSSLAMSEVILWLIASLAGAASAWIAWNTGFRRWAIAGISAPAFTLLFLFLPAMVGWKFEEPLLSLNPAYYALTLPALLHLIIGGLPAVRRRFSPAAGGP